MSQLEPAMNNTNNILQDNILKNRWVTILLVFSLVGLIATAIFRLITPTEPVAPKTEFITTNQAGGSTSFNNIRFTGSPPSPIESLPLATIQPSQTTLDYVREQLIANYQLQQVVGISGLWSGNTHTLSYNEEADEYLFYALDTLEDSLLTEPNLAIENAQAFVRATFPNLPLVAQRESVTYFQGLEELEETTRSEAMALEISFAYAVENIPVYIGHQRTAPITVVVNSLNEIQKVVFQPHFLTITPAEELSKVIDLSAALESINNRDEASIVSAYETTTGVFSLAEIQDGALDSVRLEYRADLESGLAYPFYRLTGELVNTDGQTIQAEIITPAVKTQ